MNFKPKILDRYLVGQLMLPFVGGIFFFIFILLLFQVIRLTPFFVNHGASLWEAGSILATMSVTFIPISFPISFLFSILLTFGRLSADSEWIALRAAGYSIERALAPVLISGIFLSAICLYASLDLVPWADFATKEKFHRITGNKVAASLESGTFRPGFFNLAIYVNEVQPSTGELKGVFLFDEREKDHPLSIIAKEGQLIPRIGKDDLPVAILLRLRDGSLHSTPKLLSEEENLDYQKVDFDTYNLLIKIPELSPYQTDRPKGMRLPFLMKQINKYANHNSVDELSQYKRLRMELWKRISLSATCLIFALLGVGLGIQKTRSVKSTSFIMCIIVLVAYYGIFLLFSDLVWQQKVPLPLGMMAANILFLIGGVTIVHKARRA